MTWLAFERGKGEDIILEREGERRGGGGVYKKSVYIIYIYIYIYIYIRARERPKIIILDYLRMNHVILD